MFLPADPRLKWLAVQIEEERNHALVVKPEAEPLVERGERSEEDEGVPRAVVQRGRDDDVLQTTQPGEALQLFAEPAPPPPSPALAAFTAAPAPPSAPSRRRPRTSAASACARSARRSSRPSPAGRARRTARSTAG